jgi:hypothetical protein
MGHPRPALYNLLVMKWQRYLELVVDVAVAFGGYYFLGWIGFALWVFFVMSRYCVLLITAQQDIRNTLLSRLPDRCTFCHREIVDEGGMLDEDGIYHAACSDKLDALEDLRKEAGVRYSEAIQNPKPKTPAK